MTLEEAIDKLAGLSGEVTALKVWTNRPLESIKELVVKLSPEDQQRLYEWMNHALGLRI